MYIRIGNRVVNAANITDVEIGEVDSMPLVKVHLVGDRMVKFSDDEAEAFLAALPTYSPVVEEA
jgi:hypothetical protein